MGKQIPAPRFVYRYLQEERFAREFCEGKVWLSTLNHIRYCDASRADPDEASTHFTVTEYSNSTPPEQAATIKERLRGAIDPGMSDFRIEGTVIMSQERDSYVLCTTLETNRRMRSNFGQYCVRIEHPAPFFKLLTNELEKTVELFDSGFGPMQYGGRKLVGAEPGPGGHAAFRNVHGNASEKEARMLWIPKQPYGLTPMMLHVPEVARLCKII